MIQTHFNNEGRQNPKEDFEHENAQEGDRVQDRKNRLEMMSHRRIKEHGKKLSRKAVEGRDRWRSLVHRRPTQSGNVLGGR
jgi:hypothetical protein